MKTSLRNAVIFISGAGAALWALVWGLSCGNPADIGDRNDVGWYTANPGAAVFTISTASELAGLAAIVNGTWGGTPRSYDFSGRTVTLANSIDLSEYKNWVPIGNWTVDTAATYSRYSFSGIFNGGGNVISNLTINRPTQRRQGLFGHINNGKVEKLGIDNADITGFGLVGGLAGLLTGNSGIANCYSTGRISISNDGDTRVGGVAGSLEGGSSVVTCYSTAAVSGKGMAGGIAGSVDGNSSVINCAALNPEVKGDENAGRVAGALGDNAVMSNNAAYAEMKNSAEDTTWDDKGANAKDGTDITNDDIRHDGTINDLFADPAIWTTQPGKLPGLRGTALELPVHLR